MLFNPQDDGRRSPFPQRGRFYKANLHGHTRYSDGRLTPEQTAQLYRAQGYAVYAFTDHLIEIARRGGPDAYIHHIQSVATSDFLPLTGFEITFERQRAAGEMRPAGNIHLNVIASVPQPSQTPPLSVYGQSYTREDVSAMNRLIAGLSQAGYRVHFNHPAWSGGDSAIYLGLEGYQAMEIYNSTTDHLSQEGDSSLIYQKILESGRMIGCLATDDVHGGVDELEAGCFDGFQGWTMIHAEELTYNSIFQALDAGRYYCSTGPEIYDLEEGDGVVRLSCSPAARIFCKGLDSHSPLAAYGRGGLLTEAYFDLRQLKGSPFARFEIVDSQGRSAWTNPYPLKEDSTACLI